MNIIAYKTKTQTVFGELMSCYRTTYRANGNPLRSTFLANWHQVDGDLESLVEVKTIRVNERYELINKELYNEKIPLMIDDSTKDKFKPLIESELYKYVYDTEEQLIDIPFEVIEVDAEVRFDIKTAKEFNPEGRSWAFTKRHYYIIELLEHRTVDMCLFPRPLLDLTRPCKLGKNKLFHVLTDMIAVNIPNNCRIKTNDGNIFVIVDFTKSKELIYWKDWSSRSYEKGSTFYQKELFGNNYDDLMGRLNAFVKYIIKKLSECDSRGIDIAIDEMAQGKDFREDIEEVKE